MVDQGKSVRILNCIQAKMKSSCRSLHGDRKTGRLLSIPQHAMRGRQDSGTLSDCGRAPESDDGVLTMAGGKHKIDELYSRGVTPIVFNMMLMRRQRHQYFSLRIRYTIKASLWWCSPGSDVNVQRQEICHVNKNSLKFTGTLSARYMFVDGSFSRPWYLII